MVYEKSPKVYVCCGQYYATNKATEKRKIVCKRCGEVIKTPVVTPKIILVHN